MSINKLVDKVNGLLGKFPCYFQYDQMDCGPAALSAVSSYYGKKYSIQELREYCHLSKDGVSLLGIEDAANEIGFDTLAVRVTAEEMIKKHPFHAFCIGIIVILLCSINPEEIFSKNIYSISQIQLSA